MMSPQMTSRRKVLRTAGSSLLAGIGLAHNVSGQLGGSKPTPVAGTRIYQVKRSRTGDGLRLYESFHGGVDLADEIGRPIVRYGFENIRRRTFEQLQESDQWNEPNTNNGGNIILECKFSDTAIIGEMEQHFEVEKRINELQRESHNNSFQITPKYVYKGDNPSSWQDLAERTGPINLGWDIGKDASSVASEHNTSGSWAIQFAGTRYIINAYGITIQKEDIGQNVCITPQCSSPNQYHARLYDNNHKDDSARVIGQAHYDPVDHGQITNPDWRFAEARNELSEHWTDITTKNMYNGSSFSSSNGDLDLISGNVEDDDDGGLDIPFIIL